VIEINTGGEFKGLMTTTDHDIAGEIVEEAARMALTGIVGPADPALYRTTQWML
jgi:hypothetical protein